MQWSLTLLQVSGESDCVERPKKIVRTDLERTVLNYDEVTTIFYEAANIICPIKICNENKLHEKKSIHILNIFR